MGRFSKGEPDLLKIWQWFISQYSEEFARSDQPDENDHLNLKLFSASPSFEVRLRSLLSFQLQRWPLAGEGSEV